MSSDPYHSPRYPGGRRGMMFVLSSPSGAGKTTLSKRLMDKNPDILISVSWTTRAPRPGEENGRDYVFVSEDACGAGAQRTGACTAGAVRGWGGGEGERLAIEATAVW